MPVATSNQIRNLIFITSRYRIGRRTLFQRRISGAGVPEHFHLHMLPRWQGDTSFMTTVGDTRIMPETLSQTYARLRPILSDVLADRS